MSNVSDKSFLYRSYPKLAYGSTYEYLFDTKIINNHFINKTYSIFNTIWLGKKVVYQGLSVSNDVMQEGKVKPKVVVA